MLALLRPFAGYIALGAACLILLTLWQLDKAGAQKWKARAETYRVQLDAISTKQNEQNRTSERNVGEVLSGQDRGKQIVERIVRVPNPENCATPQIETEGLL